MKSWIEDDEPADDCSVILSSERGMRVHIDEERKFDELPTEVVRYEIFQYMEPETLLEMRLSNKFYKNLIDEDFELLAEDTYFNFPSRLARIFFYRSTIKSPELLDRLSEKLTTNLRRKIILKDSEGLLEIITKDAMIQKYSDVLLSEIEKSEEDINFLGGIANRLGWTNRVLVFFIGLNWCDRIKCWLLGFAMQFPVTLTYLILKLKFPEAKVTAIFATGLSLANWCVLGAFLFGFPVAVIFTKLLTRLNRRRTEREKRVIAGTLFERVEREEEE